MSIILRDFIGLCVCLVGLIFCIIFFGLGVMCIGLIKISMCIEFVIEGILLFVN